MKKFLVVLVAALLAQLAAAIGTIGQSGNWQSYTWTSDPTIPYSPNADGSFNINPVGGVDGVFIGMTSLRDLVGGGVSSNSTVAFAVSLAPGGADRAKLDAAITSAPPQSVVSVNGQTGVVSVTAASIGAVGTNTGLRVYDSGGGVWKLLLPGEVQP